MTKPQTTPDFVSIEDVAKALETTELNVLMHIKRKLLAAQEADGVWQVTRESLEHFLRTGKDRQGVELCRSSCAKKGGCTTCG